jgi:hypothetical protein
MTMIKCVTRILVFSVSGAVIALVCGCATLPFPKDEGEELRDRVVRMMEAKTTGNWDLVYDYYDPAFRSSTSKGEARVEISNDISMQGFDFKDAPETQHWVNIDGKWYYKVRSLPVPIKSE